MHDGSPVLRRFLRRLVRIAFAVVALVMLLALAAAGAWWAARPVTPDAFYSPPAALPEAPGVLIRHERFARQIPAGALAWRILYTTTRADDTRAVASAIVLTSAASAAAPRPIVAWAHGTTGLAAGCAPSVMPDPFANLPARDVIVPEGLTLVATDYAGLGTPGGHAYLVGEDAARSVLDSVRAARQLPGLVLDSRFVVWGHSQGGNSALWSGIRAGDYAPGIKLLGVAALAPATDLRTLVATAQGSLFGRIVSAYLVSAYDARYADVAQAKYVRAGAERIVRDIAGRCVGGLATLVSAAAALLLPRDGIFDLDPTDGPLGSRLLDNTPLAPIQAPVFIAQGRRDDLVLPAVQQSFVNRRCAAGQAIDYRVYPGLDHVTLVGRASPLAADLIAWTHDRFAGRPAANTCRK